MEDIIEVVCCAMPSGEAFWFEAKDEGYLRKFMDAWKEQNPEYMDTRVTSGAVVIKIPREKYIAIGATNQGFQWP